MEVESTITSKGQITIPATVRKHLHVTPGDKLTFVIEEDGRVEVRPTRYATVESLRGAAGSLAEPRTWEEMRVIAREDREADLASRT